MFSEVVKNQLEALNTILPNITVYGVPKSSDGNRKRLPSSVSLDGKDIDKIDIDEDVIDILDEVVSLHLNNNNISSWNDILILLKHKPNLKALNVSCNPFKPPDCVDTNFIYPYMNSLVLNEINASWDMVIKILPSFPNLEELHLCKNAKSLNSSDFYFHSNITFPNLRQMFYNCNECSNLSDLVLIGQLFPNLENLVCLDNQLGNLLESPQSLHDFFPNLSILNISENKLTDWDSIDYLNTFPVLRELRIANQPLFQFMDIDDVWTELVARLDKLMKLNGSTILTDHRIDAERAFVRSYWDAEFKPEKFHQLKQRYPDVRPLANIDLGNANLTKYKRLTLTFGQGRTVDIRLDIKSMTIDQLKSRICCMLGLGNSAETNQRLLLWRSGSSNCEEMTPSDRLVESFCGCWDGDRLFINIDSID